ncbi:MAG: hypothetical protein KAU01_11880 [Candidatus Cloacimonetes bacterium]|nr:hypothetical protein [Candidatus Cloacimonadota bacterium]
MLLKIKVVLAFIIIFTFLLAQDAEETILSLEDGTYHPTELSETLMSLRQLPLNINNASSIELTQLPWLSELDIGKIIKARNTKPISGWKELRNIGINEITISKIKDYIVFREKPGLKLNQRTRGEYSESKDNFESTLKYYQRTICGYKDLKLGILTQKDEGETDPIDFYSYFVEYKSNSFIKHTVLGKYRLAFGQGIIFAPKLGMSKSGAATSTPVKKSFPIKPYTSSYEIWELEGGTVQCNYRNFSIIPFFSSTKLSANLSDNKITSFNQSGLHLDEDKKDNVKETILGTALNFNFGTNSFGVNFSQFEFDHEFKNPDWSNKYQAFSANFILNRDNFPSFGEIAFADDKFAGVIGTKFGENQFRHLLLFRYYEKNFPTWHGNPFSTQSRFDDEVGLYYGITLLPFKRTKINCYFDVWNFPETRYFEKMPTVGSEQFIQLETHFKTNSLRVTLQHKSKEKYISLDHAKIRDFDRTILRVDWWQMLGNICLKTRCELVAEYLQNEKIYEKGILAYEQLKWIIEDFEIIAQIAVYHSDVLHYMYESNVDGIMQNSILQGDGIYSYMLVKYNLLENMELQFKVSDHWYSKDKMRLYLQVVSRF